MANSLTYTDGSVKESVINLISIINPDETQLLNGLQRSKALGPVHQWLKQDISAVDTTLAGNVEGAALGTATTTDPTRLTNYTQIFKRVWGVSGTQIASAHYDKDAKARAMDEAMRVIGNDMEFAFMRGTTAGAGSSSTARTLKGIKSWITTNTAAGSGATFTQALLDANLQKAYTAGGKVDSLYVSGAIKLKVDAFTGNTRNINASDNTVVSAVNVYESSFGVIKIYLHRYVTVSGTDTNNDLVGLDTKRWAIAVLRDVANTDIATTTDGETGAFIGEVTLEARNEKSSIVMTNYV